jgi:hypothetical protein
VVDNSTDFEGKLQALFERDACEQQSRVERLLNERTKITGPEENFRLFFMK